MSVSEADESMPQKYKRKRGLDGKVIRGKIEHIRQLTPASKQPRKRLDAQLGILRDGDKPPDKVAPREYMSRVTDIRRQDSLPRKTQLVA